MLIETLVSKSAIEALDKSVLRGLRRANEIQTRLVLVGPAVERLTGKLWSVIGHNDLGQSMFLSQAFQYLHDSGSGDRSVYLNDQHSTVDSRDQPSPPAPCT